MSESIAVILGSPLPLSFTTPDGSSGRFIRAIVYDSTQTPVVTKDIGPGGEVSSTGRYADSTFTPGAVGHFTAHYIVYTDGTYGTELEIFEQDQDSFTVLDPALFGYLAADRARDDQIASETAAIDGRLPDDPADESVQLAAHAATQGAGFVTGTDSLEAIRDRGDAAWVTGTGLTPQQARDAMKLSPSGGVPDTGSVDKHLDDLLVITGAIDTLTAAALNATVGSRAIPGDAMALTSAARTLVAEAVRDVNLAAAASGSLGEGIIVAKNSKLAYRIDNYDRDNDTGFAKSARIRIFASQAAAAASTAGNPDGDDNELEKATLTGTPHGTFVVLPIDIVTGP